MDAADVDPAELRRALRFIRRINAGLVAIQRERGANASGERSIRFRGGTTTRARRRDRLGRPDAIAIATAGGTAGPIARSSRARSAIELTLAEAPSAECADLPCVRFVLGDALALPLADASVDVVVSTMFLHHLPDDVAVGAALARDAARRASHAVVVADLLRDARAYRWISLFTAWRRRRW